MLCFASVSSFCKQDVMTLLLLMFWIQSVLLLLAGLFFFLFVLVLSVAGFWIYSRNTLLPAFIIRSIYIYSILLYDVETMKLNKKQIVRYEAICGFIWECGKSARVSNKEVLKKAGTERMLNDWIIKRKVACFGHFIKGNNYEILQLRVQRQR